MSIILAVNWSPNLSDPATAAIGGAIVGGLLSFISTYYFNYRQQTIHQKRLQTALIAEIEALDVENLREATDSDDLVELLEMIEDIPDIGSISRDSISPLRKRFTSEVVQSGSTMWISTRVIDANMSNIGTLKKHQIEKVIELYNIIETVRQDIEDLVNSLEQDPGSIIKEFESAQRTLENHIDTLEMKRTEALKSLSNECRLSDISRLLNSRR